MPCYEPEAPWEKAQQTDCREAARILCTEVRRLLPEGNIPKEILVWFVGHRKIDLQIATTPYFGNPSEADAAQIKADIEQAEKLLAM